MLTQFEPVTACFNFTLSHADAQIVFWFFLTNRIDLYLTPGMTNFLTFSFTEKGCFDSVKTITIHIKQMELGTKML